MNEYLNKEERMDGIGNIELMVMFQNDSIKL